MGINTPGTLNTAGQMVKFDPVLRKKSLPPDIFGMSRESIGEEYVSQKEGKMVVDKVPEEIFVDITSGYSKGAIKQQIEFLDSLNSPGVTGLTQLEDDTDGEEAQTYRGLTTLVNMVRKGVPYYGDGPNAHELTAYKGIKKIAGQLGQWMQDDTGYGIRHALFENISYELEVAPASQTAKLHPHIYCAGPKGDVSDDDQPAANYSTTASTYANAIGVGLKAVPTDATGGWTLDNLARLSEFCKDKNIRMLNTSKGKQWILVVSPRGISQMYLNPELREVLKDADVRGPKNQIFAGLKGPIFNFLIYEDWRLPRVTVTGSEGSWSVAASYYGHGTTDNRTGGYDLNMVLGPGAVVRGNAIAPHMIEHVGEDYGLKLAKGVSTTRTLMRMQFDIGTPTSSSYVVDGSLMYATYRDAGL